MAYIRTEPGIKVSYLVIMILCGWAAIKTGSIFLLGVTVYLCFSAFVAEGFYPYISDEDAIEIRRNQWLEEQERIEEDRDNET